MIVATKCVPYYVINTCLWWLKLPPDDRHYWRTLLKILPSHGKFKFSSISLLSLHILPYDFLYIVLYEKSGHTLHNLYSFKNHFNYLYFSVPVKISFLKWNFWFSTASRLWAVFMFSSTYRYNVYSEVKLCKPWYISAVMKYNFTDDFQVCVPVTI